MLDFFASISDAIVTFLQFLFNQVQNLFAVLQMLVHGSAFLTQCIAFLPSMIAPFAVTAITISVIYLIIGR